MPNSIVRQDSFGKTFSSGGEDLLMRTPHMHCLAIKPKLLDQVRVVISKALQHPHRRSPCKLIKRYISFNKRHPTEMTESEGNCFSITLNGLGLNSKPKASARSFVLFAKSSIKRSDRPARIAWSRRSPSRLKRSGAMTGRTNNLQLGR